MVHTSQSNLTDGLSRRVWIETVYPEVDGGKWLAKGVIGDRFVVEADLVCDGHDIVIGTLLYRHGQSGSFKEAPLEHTVNDRYSGGFELSELGTWQYTVEAWVDEFLTWQRKLRKKSEAKQDVSIDLLIGAKLVAHASEFASGHHKGELEQARQTLESTNLELSARIEVALDRRLGELMARYPDRRGASRFERTLGVRAERAIARFSAWYELFPRSTGAAGSHGTFRDAEAILPYVAGMGFDILYLPPIHPIGRSHRKGKNNSLVAAADDPGSPWAIGSSEGGHKSVHPELGTLADFRQLVNKARDNNLELALDIAFQVSPDHPYVTEHPEWFKHRPDGTIQYAENPPKEYQDIYPFDFSCAAWQSLWHELKSVFLFWIEQGVRIFRVDNPHTKQLSFWAWCLREVQEHHPDTIFLAEAFTRPKLMYALAKAGFSQSYTYFTWRESAYELSEYLRELTSPPLKDFFRPNFWPNTPDILPEHLQYGGRPAFIARLVLATTLTSNYGIYGPAFELMEHVARPGSEEYIDNEKYELKAWNLDDPKSLRPIIARLNQARRAHRALQDNRGLRFHHTDNEQLLCYSKLRREDHSLILVVVNLDFNHTQSGWVYLDLNALGISESDSFQVHDLLSGAHYTWHGSRNYVELNPHHLPAHVFAVRLFVRREQDFDYFA